MKSLSASTFLLFLFILCFPGCVRVGPDFKQPATGLAPDWTEIKDPRLNKDLPRDRDWWEYFQDPVLSRLISRAAGQNLTLRQAGLRVLEARAQLAQTAGQLFPQSQQVSGHIQYNRISERSLQAGFTGSQYGQSDVAFSAAWEIDFWGKYRRAIESAEASWLSTIDDYDSALVSLTADVADAYLLIRTLGKRIGIARQNVVVQEDNLKIVEARVRFGLTTDLDLEQARTALINTRSSIPVLETRLRQTQNALSLLLGLPPGDLSELLTGPGEIPVPPAQIAVGVPADLLRRRPDIRSLEQLARAQGARIGLAKADLYPAFSLSGFFGFLSTDVGQNHLTDLLRWDARTWQIGPSFQWNLFNFGRIKNNVRVQDARFEQQVTAYQNSVLKAQQEVENALAAYLKSQDRAALLAQGAEAARRALDLSLLQYREGAKDFTTVLIAQQTLLSQQDNLTDTLGTIALNLVAVYRALGGGWEIREGHDLVPPVVRQKMAQRTDWGRLLDLTVDHSVQRSE